MIGKLVSSGFVFLSFATMISLISQEGNGLESLNGLQQNTSQLTWDLFKEPENKFAMQYPSSWVLEPAVDRSSNVDVEIVNSYHTMNGLVPSSILYH